MAAQCQHQTGYPAESPGVRASKDSGEVNEGELVLGEDSDFDIEGGSSHLGRSQPSEPAKDAENQQKISNIHINRASVGLNIREVAWGTFNNKEACRIYLDLTIMSTTQFRLTNTYLTCTVLPIDSGQPGSASAVTVPEPPKVLRYLPRDSVHYRQGATGSSITTTAVLEPQVSLGNVGASIGSVTKQRTYEPFHGIDVSGIDSFADETVQWSISNCTRRDRQTIYTLEAEVLVEHHGTDFSMKFELETVLHFLKDLETLKEIVRSLGRNRAVTRYRNFRVLPSIGVLN